MKTNHIWGEHINRLTKHDSFRLNASHTPTQYAEAVNHGRVAIGAHDGVWVVGIWAVGGGVGCTGCDPLEIDLVYDIAKGSRYKVGRINVMIDGDNPHTQRTVALNRIDLRPGDIVDIRKIRDSERRLRASGLFLNDIERGVKPKIVFSTGSRRGLP